MKPLSIALLLLLALAGPRPVFGQDREASASVGYQRQHVSDTDANGLFADAALQVAGPLDLVGGIDWVRHRSEAFGFDQSLTSLAAAGGVRVRVGSGRVVPFAQLLVGAQRDTLRVERFGSDASTHGLVQAGGGLAASVVRRLSVVGQIDWRHVGSGQDEDRVRLLIGARLRLH